MAQQAVEEAEEHMDTVERAKQSESQTILQFLRENVTQWKQRIRDADDGDNSKRNLFSQNDSEAQFIEQDPLSEDDDDDSQEV